MKRTLPPWHNQLEPDVKAISTPLEAPPLRQKAQDGPLNPTTCPICGATAAGQTAVKRLKTMLERAVNAWLKTINTEKP